MITQGFSKCVQTKQLQTRRLYLSSSSSSQKHPEFSLSWRRNIWSSVFSCL